MVLFVRRDVPYRELRCGVVLFKELGPCAHFGLQAPVFRWRGILEKQGILVIRGNRGNVERKPCIPVRHFFQVLLRYRLARDPETAIDFRWNEDGLFHSDQPYRHQHLHQNDGPHPEHQTT